MNKLVLKFFFLLFCFANAITVFGQDINEATERKNKIVSFYHRANFEEFEKEYPAYMEFAKKNKLWEDYFGMFNCRTSILCRQQKFDEAIQEAENLLESARELNLPFALGTLNRCFGQIYFYQHRFDLAETHYYKALSYFHQTQNLKSELDVYRDLANALQSQNKYKELEKVILDMEKTYQKYAHQLGKDDLPVLFQIHRIQISIHVFNRRFDKALTIINQIETYINQLPESAYNYFQVTLLGFFKAQEKYSEALTVVDSLYNYYVKTNQKLYCLEMLGEQIALLARLNRSNEIVEKFVLYHQMQTAMETENANFKLDQLRTQYETEKLTAEKEQNRNYFLFALGGCILLFLTLGIWIRYSRTIIRKNRDLYRQIKEQDSLAEELETMTKPGTRQQQQLVSRLREHLHKERNFSKYDIDIQNLVSEMATSRTPLFEAIKAVTGKTPMEFINHIRLEEAKRLLDHSDRTIETIATECGFQTPSTFYRQFRDRYRITPAEYRKSAKSDEMISAKIPSPL